MIMAIGGRFENAHLDILSSTHGIFRKKANHKGLSFQLKTEEFLGKGTKLIAETIVGRNVGIISRRAACLISLIGEDGEMKDLATTRSNH